MTSLTQALPLTQGIYNRIQFLLTDYMTNVNVWTMQIFGSAQYAYIKDDLASKQRPSIFIYPLTTQKKSFGYSYLGTLVMELHFGLYEQRTNIPEIATQIIGDIELINLNQQFSQYLQLNMPGLQWFGKNTKSDYSKLYAKECVANIEFDFNVDLLAYQSQLQHTGYDITSPDQQIYPLAEALFEQIALLNADLNPVIIQ